ncbi:MAG: bifunctional phosphoribosylaminoimidazolecarboxamide formyltransferase/IMP cyclohydrolase [Dehalococcoidia bacterium]|nr:bifunctional phosphoribosylaminoimidazolecarboxamide formyltransferase/IMP cyclohydrolase [Dehalococcoidia bacterium]
MKALLSVYDKTGIVEFARKLHAAGMELVSTGGTFSALKRAGLPVAQVADLTRSPEMMDGRVKTLHPAIHGGILARRDLPAHMAELKQHGIATIDLVAVNLYPFEATVSKPGVTLEDALENIDIGGPAMLRAASKNFPAVTVVTNPADYNWVAERTRNGGPSQEERRRLAAKAFQHVAAYDSLVARWLRGADAEFPAELPLSFRKVTGLRYGENPHQKAALYAEMGVRGGIVGARQLGGKELSFNNLLDAEAAWRVVSDFAEPTVCVVKHNNPCGLASHDDLAEAYRRAYEGDTVSAFGGIVGFNRTVTAQTADAMRKIFYEVIVAPEYAPEALEILQKKRDLRILAVPLVTSVGGQAPDLRRVSGGLLAQTPDEIAEDPSTWKPVTERKPTQQELAQLAFAWKTAKHVKSNAIVLVNDMALAGMGAGQPNRVTSVHLALRAAGEKAKGSVLASDAFFPFPDGLELAAQGGVTAVAQPGGSIRDAEVIAAANKAGIAMVFTGVRHFRH